MASEANREGINLGIDGVDKDNGLELTQNIQKFLITEPANQRGLNTAGSKVVNSNDLLIEILVGEGAKLRSGSVQNVDDQEDILSVLETATFEVPGITKKGEKKTLSELWPNKFNLDDGKYVDLNTGTTSMKYEEKSLLASIFSNVGIGGVRPVD